MIKIEERILIVPTMRYINLQNLTPINIKIMLKVITHVATIKRKKIKERILFRSKGKTLINNSKKIGSINPNPIPVMRKLMK
ncbi:MAG: hypothetical protein ACFE9V_01535 [Candidatus Hodarchaeota archaeon]